MQIGRFPKIFITGLVTVLSIGVIAYATEAGSQNDPLITLGYLNGPFSQQIQAETEKKISDASDILKADLADKVEAYSAEVEDKLSGVSLEGGTGSSTYTVVSLASGQTITGGVGCEVMLRIGSAVCVAGGSPGLIDTTAGNSLENGKQLETNHLYMVTINGRSVRATSSAKLLVRGDYIIA